MKLDDFIFDTPARRGIKHLNVPKYSSARGLRQRTLQQMRLEFQIVPPITLHYSNDQLMAANWALTREVLVANNCERVELELVAAITSKLNTCPFCEDVHTSMLYGANDTRALTAIANNLLPGDHYAALVAWAKSTLSPKSAALSSFPFSEEQKPFFIGTALAFHYTNRMVNVFLEDSPLPLKISNRKLNKLSSRIMGRLIGRKIVSVKAMPGHAIYQEANALMPSGFAWAHKNTNVRNAISTFANVIAEAGKHSLSENSREAVCIAVSNWNGEEMPLNRVWIDDALFNLSEKEKLGAEIALLTALASYRVTDTIIEKFKRQHPQDLDLVNVTSWGAFIAMQRISGWIDEATNSFSESQIGEL